MTAQTQTTPNDQLIRTALRANALFSVGSGLLFLLGAPAVAEFLGIATYDVFGFLAGPIFIFMLGMAILGFGGMLLYMTTRPILDLTQARGVFMMDVAWVVVSGLILITGALPLTTAGSWGVLVITDIVAVFAIAEYFGLRRVR